MYFVWRSVAVGRSTLDVLLVSGVLRGKSLFTLAETLLMGICRQELVRSRFSVLGKSCLGGKAGKVTAARDCNGLRWFLSQNCGEPTKMNK